MENYIVFDIETIPTTEKVGDSLNLRLHNRAEKISEEENYEETCNRLRATSPFYGQVVAIGMHAVNGTYPDGIDIPLVANGIENVVGNKVLNEKQLLETFWQTIEGFTGRFVGFNSIGFDAYFIITRSMYHRISITNKNFLNLRMYQSWPHYDVMHHLGNWKFENRISLDAACEFFGIRSPKDGDVTAKNVYTHFLDGNIKGIADYCMDDVKATKEIYDITKNYIKD
jgi:predicted PolB exonuclease-like 3'-5' exonuclease